MLGAQGRFETCSAQRSSTQLVPNWSRINIQFMPKTCISETGRVCIKTRTAHPVLQIVEHRSALDILITSSSFRLSVVSEYLLRVSGQRNAGSITTVACDFSAAVFCCYTTEVVNTPSVVQRWLASVSRRCASLRRVVSRRCIRKAQHVRRYMCRRLSLRKFIRSDVCLRRSSRTCSGTHQRARSSTCPAVIRLCMLCSASARTT